MSDVLQLAIFAQITRRVVIELGHAVVHTHAERNQQIPGLTAKFRVLEACRIENPLLMAYGCLYIQQSLRNRRRHDVALKSLEPQTHTGPEFS